ncbi:MAG: hypothetical protein OXK80_02340 [Bdellovibrionales bacterium]|nr:hypothetical protein [Bdellovibrionales bacterium]
MISKRNLLTLFCLYFCTSCSPTQDLFSESLDEVATERFYIKLDENFYKREGIAVPEYALSSDDLIGLTDCGVNKGDESFEDIYCILDLNEADIGVLGQADKGIPIEYNIPRHMCEYTTFMAPWHWNYRSGIGPQVLHKHTEEEDTSDTTIVVGGEGNESNNAEYYCIPPSGTRRCAGNPVTSAVPCPIGQPNPGTWYRIDEDSNVSKCFCPYDHSSAGDGNSNAPNCCFGSYEVEGGNEGTETNDWGGDLKECIGGPLRSGGWDNYAPTVTSVSHTQKPIEIPIPNRFYSWVTDEPRRTFEIGPIDIETILLTASGNRYFYSTPTATYFDGIEDLIFTDPLSCSNCPSMFSPDVDNPIENLALRAALRAYPYFTLECLDSNMEALHRVHLTIREWNTQEEFLSFKESNGGSGDPDIDGEEGSDCPYYEADEKLGSTNCNDFLDLDDFIDIGIPYPRTPY